MLSGDTPVTITMGKLIAGIALLGATIAGVLWGVLSFTIGGVRDDVSAIRQSVIALQTADKEGIARSNEINIRLTEQIQGLRVDFVKYAERFDVLSGRIDGMNKSIDIFTGRLEKFQNELNSAQASWNDPKRISTLVEALKKEGLDQKVIILQVR